MSKRCIVIVGIMIWAVLTTARADQLPPVASPQQHIIDNEIQQAVEQMKQCMVLSMDARYDHQGVRDRYTLASMMINDCHAYICKGLLYSNPTCREDYAQSIGREWTSEIFLERFVYGIRQ